MHDKNYLCLLPLVRFYVRKRKKNETTTTNDDLVNFWKYNLINMEFSVFSFEYINKIY